MKKIVVSVALATAVAGVSLAEESAVFVGVEGGVSLQNNEFNFSDETLSNLLTQNGFTTYNSNYGVVLGYKQMFSPRFGLRYYANFNHHIIDMEGAENTNARRFHIFNYGVNVDFLANFIAGDSFDFGGFIGLGLGETTASGKYVDDIKKELETNNKKLKTTYLDVALNVGLRTNIAKHHGIEVFGRIPFVSTETKINADTVMINHPYSVNVRYVFSF